ANRDQQRRPDHLRKVRLSLLRRKPDEPGTVRTHVGAVSGQRLTAPRLSGRIVISGAQPPRRAGSGQRPGLSWCANPGADATRLAFLYIRLSSLTERPSTPPAEPAPHVARQAGQAGKRWKA